MGITPFGILVFSQRKDVLDDGSLVSSRVVKRVALAQVYAAFKDYGGTPKLLLRFTTWPLINFCYQFGTCFRTFIVFRCYPGQCLSLHGVLLHEVTSPLLRSVTGCQTANFDFIAQPLIADGAKPIIITLVSHYDHAKHNLQISNQVFNLSRNTRIQIQDKAKE